jgi:hypothetical protein
VSAAAARRTILKIAGSDGNASGREGLADELFLGESALACFRGNGFDSAHPQAQIERGRAVGKDGARWWK